MADEPPVHEGKVLHDLTEIHGALGFQVLGRQLRHRRCLGETLGSPDVGAGYDNFFHRCLVLRQAHACDGKQRK